MITHPKVGGIGPSKSVTHTRPPHTGKIHYVTHIGQSR